MPRHAATQQVIQLVKPILAIGAKGGTVLDGFHLPQVQVIEGQNAVPAKSRKSLIGKGYAVKKKSDDEDEIPENAMDPLHRSYASAPRQKSFVKKSMGTGYFALQGIGPQGGQPIQGGLPPGLIKICQVTGHIKAGTTNTLDDFRQDGRLQRQ